MRSPNIVADLLFSLTFLEMCSSVLWLSLGIVMLFRVAEKLTCSCSRSHAAYHVGVEAHHKSSFA